LKRAIDEVTPMSPPIISNQSKFDKVVELMQLRQNPPPEGLATLPNVKKAVVLRAREPLTPVIVTL